MERDWLEQIFLEALKGNSAGMNQRQLDKEKLKDFFETSYPIASEYIEKYVKKVSKNYLKQQRKYILGFKKRLLSRWGKAIDLLEIFIAFNLEYGVNVSKTYTQQNNKDVRFKTLLRIHARACQIASEIIELIKGGFADGAIARWRTLHELSITANFLADKPDSLTEKYLDYYFIENYQEMVEYQKNCDKLRYLPLSEEELKEAKNQIELLELKYGSEFKKPYGWASEYLPNGKRTFAGMEETISYKFVRSIYKMANNTIHGGIKGAIFKLGMYNKQDELMLSGPSNYGFADPGYFAAFSLFQTTITLSSSESYLEDSIFMNIGKKMLDELNKEFYSIQKNIEEEEDNLHNC